MLHVSKECVGLWKPGKNEPRNRQDHDEDVEGDLVDAYVVRRKQKDTEQDRHDNPDPIDAPSESESEASTQTDDDHAQGEPDDQCRHSNFWSDPVSVEGSADSGGHRNSRSPISSIGFLNASRLRGRSLSSWATHSRSEALWIERSVPFGKYWRSRPLVFSFVPRCQGECGSQK